MTEERLAEEKLIGLEWRKKFLATSPPAVLKAAVNGLNARDERIMELQGECLEQEAALMRQGNRIKELSKLLEGAAKALLSYQFGNSSPELAKDYAEAIQTMLKDNV